MLVKLNSVNKRGKKNFDYFMFISRNIYSLVWLGDYWQRVMDFYHDVITWWRHQVETFSALLDICAGNSPASGEFPAQRPVTRSFDVFFDLCLNKRLRKQLARASPSSTETGQWVCCEPAWALQRVPDVSMCHTQHVVEASPTRDWNHLEPST